MDKTYRIDCGFDRLTVRADLDRAEAPIRLVRDDGSTEPTGYRTADAGHDTQRLAALAVLHCGREYYRSPDDRREDDEEYVVSLVRSVREIE